MCVVMNVDVCGGVCVVVSLCVVRVCVYGECVSVVVSVCVW